MDGLDDAALIASLHSLVRDQRSSMSRIIAHLGEVEARRLHAVRGYCFRGVALAARGPTLRTTCRSLATVL